MLRRSHLLGAYAPRVPARVSDIADRLIDAAARVLADDGPSALSARRLARECGTSTMAVYTHHGSMEQLRVAVRRKAFHGLLAHLEGVAPTDDPIADITRIGFAYGSYARGNETLFRAAFFEAPLELEDFAAGVEAFQPVIRAVERAIAAGRITADDPIPIALACWTAAHGAAALPLSGLVEAEVAISTLATMAEGLFTGFGDDPKRARASVRRALRATAAAEA